MTGPCLGAGAALGLRIGEQRHLKEPRAVGESRETHTRERPQRGERREKKGGKGTS